MPEQNPKKVKTVKAVCVSAEKESPSQATVQAAPDEQAPQAQQVPQAQQAPQAQQVPLTHASNVLSFNELEYEAPNRQRQWVSSHRKKAFYQQWWFWLAVALLVLIIAILLGLL